MSKSAPYHSLGSPILTQIFKKRFREKEAKSFFFQQKKAENLNVSLPLHSICILHSLPHPTSVIFIQIKIFWVSIIPLLHDTRQHRVLLSSAPVRCYNKHDKQQFSAPFTANLPPTHTLTKRIFQKRRNITTSGLSRNRNKCLHKFQLILLNQI